MRQASHHARPVTAGIAAALVLMAGLALTGCGSAGQRASEEHLPALTPKVLGSTPTADALAHLARIKEPGKGNLMVALTFVEPPPKELMPSWAALDHAFAQVSGSGITYLPMDYFNLSRQPVPVPSNGHAIMSTGDPKITLQDPVSGVIRYQVLDQVKTTFDNATGADGKLEYLRLRMSLAFDRSIKTRNRGVIIRALANVGTEQVEPELNFSDDSETGRLTVTLGYVNEDGAMGPHNVIVTADVTRLGAEDRLGLIISSNGGVYYDKATVSHSLAGAVTETVGHAVFVFLCKALGLNYEQVLAEVSGGPALNVSGKTEAGNTSSTKLIRIVSGGDHQFQTGEHLSVDDIHGNSIMVTMIDPRTGSVPARRRLFVGDRVYIRDQSLDEVLAVDLHAIKFGTTAEFRETVMAQTNARKGVRTQRN